jgi:hypothetical protein
MRDRAPVLLAVLGAIDGILIWIHKAYEKML